MIHNITDFPFLKKGKTLTFFIPAPGRKHISIGENGNILRVSLASVFTNNWFDEGDIVISKPINFNISLTSEIEGEIYQYELDSFETDMGMALIKLRLNPDVEQPIP
jgi:hypothetical protein